MQIAQYFNITKVRSIHVADNQVIDDGYNVKELEEKLTIVNMQDFLKSTDTNPVVLFELLVSVAEGRHTVPQFTVIPEEEVKQMEREYEERTGKKAPVMEVVEAEVNKPKKTKKHV